MTTKDQLDEKILTYKNMSQIKLERFMELLSNINDENVKEALLNLADRVASNEKVTLKLTELLNKCLDNIV